MMTRLRTPLALLAALALATAACSDDPVEPEAPGTDVPAAQQTAVHPAGQGQIVANQYVVALEPDVDPAQAASELAGRLGGEVLHVYRHALNGFAVRLPGEEAATALANSPRVVRVEPDQVVEAIDQTLPEGIDRIDADANSTANIDGADDPMDVDIAIIDTGIDLDHGDLDAHDGVTCIDGTSSADDDNGHGTHVAGTAAAVDNGSHVVGAAPGARVHAVKVLDGSGSGTISSVICGIDWVTENATEIEVGNMSLGAQGSSENLRTAIQNSVSAGVYYAVAAGNDASDVYGSDQTFGTSDDFIPAAYPEVAAVSAMADFDGSAGGDGGSALFSGCGWIDDDTFTECFSNFSTNVVSGNPVTSPGAAIDLAAPGVSVLSTTNDGGTGSKSGTSMASPHVAGAAALYIVEQGLSPSTDSDVAAVRQALIDGGQAQADWQPGSTGDPDSNPEPLVFLGETTDTDSPPSVSITNPSDGATVSGSVTIEADASDDGSVTQVEFFVDGSSVGTDTDGSDGWSTTWDSNNVSDGEHTITAEATDDADQTSSDQITVTVDNTDDPPSVTITNPNDGETVSGTVTVTADASDDRGVEQVEFFVDGSSIGTDSDGSDGWSADWNTESWADGDHTLTAEATDTGGQTASHSISVTVDNTTETNMHVGDLDSNSVNNGSTWTAEVTATVHDPNHDPLADAVVTLSYDGRDVSGTETCTTATDGQCTVTVGGIPKRTGDVTFTVDDVSHPDHTYATGDNHDPDGDSDGTTISVSKP